METNQLTSEEDFHTCMKVWQGYLREHGTSRGVVGLHRNADGMYVVDTDPSAEGFDFYHWLFPLCPQGYFNTPADAMKMFQPMKVQISSAQPAPVVEPTPQSASPTPVPVRQSIILQTYEADEDVATGFLQEGGDKVVLHNVSTGVDVTLEGTLIVLGRSSRSSSVSLSTDITLSRRHCSLEKRGNGWVVMDLGSSNGTWVGKDRLQPNVAYPLKDNSLLRLGGVSFTVKLEDQ